MPEYTKTKIYKLVSDHMELGYYGHTTQPLDKRLNQHIRRAQRDTYQCTSKQVVDCGELSIILMEDVQCDCAKDAREKERYYIEHHPCVNKNIPNRTGKEYYQSVKERKKQYYEERKEAKRQYQLTRYYWIKSMDGMNFINV